MQDDTSFMKQNQKTIMRKGWDIGRPNTSDETLKLLFAMTVKQMSTKSRVLAYVISAAIHLRWEEGWCTGVTSVRLWKLFLSAN